MSLRLRFMVFDQATGRQKKGFNVWTYKNLIYIMSPYIRAILERNSYFSSYVCLRHTQALYVLWCERVAYNNTELAAMNMNRTTLLQTATIEFVFNVIIHRSSTTRICLRVCVLTFSMITIIQPHHQVLYYNAVAVQFREWSTWGEWSACDVTCGNGQRTRRRSCEPEPAERQQCLGNGTQIGRCRVFCAGK